MGIVSVMCITSLVAPFTGAWIEMQPYIQQEWSNGSLPSRERGLKFRLVGRYQEWCTVAPFTGAWIEIGLMWEYVRAVRVAPFTGAWIEIRLVDDRVGYARRSLHGSVD